MVHVIWKKKKSFSTHLLRVFLTLLCEDASLHKSSRQASKLVYLHIFSLRVSTCGVQKGFRRDPVRSVLKVKQHYAQQRSIWFSRTEDRTGKCSSFAPSLCGALRLQPDAQCASSVTSCPPAMGGVTHDTELSVSYPSSPGVSGNSNSSIGSRKKKLDILERFQISYSFGRHVSD